MTGMNLTDPPARPRNSAGGRGTAGGGPIPPYPASYDNVGDWSLLALLRVMLLRPRLLVGLPAIGLVLGVLAAVLSKEFIATSRIAPQVADAGSGKLAGLAAQFGVNLPTSSGGESLELYAQLLQSPDILSRVAQHRYRFGVGETGADTLDGTLIELYHIDGDTEQERVLAAVQLLEDKVAVSTNADAGLITVATTAKWPALAVAMNGLLLDLVADFNLHRRQSSAGAERRFIEARLQQAHDELESAEQALEQFLERNRTYKESPRLTFESERLQRRVDLQQQVYSNLAQAFEQARIDEVRDTPVLTVVDRPEGSVEGSAPLMRNVLLGVVLGGVLAFGITLAQAYLTRQQEQDPEAYEVLASLARKTARELAPATLLRGGLGLFRPSRWKGLPARTARAFGRLWRGEILDQSRDG